MEETMIRECRGTIITMKIIAFHLPQFHTIPENDMWWGTGFTEWTNTKKAEPLFDRHHQPREPLNDNYYNLLDESAREWQANLAQSYGIYGFCYYHYWFTGKKLLEKPLENILELGSPQFPFCLCWANHSWTRTWDGKDREILIEQKYGNENDWELHFNYLLQYFSDERYIRIDDKPLFVIFNPVSIPRCDEMLSFWNEMALGKGFKGIYFLEMLTSHKNTKDSKIFDGQIEFEPLYTIRHGIPFMKAVQRPINRVMQNLVSLISSKYVRNFYNTLDYDYVWQKIIGRKIKNKKTYLGAFVDWDNTARRGSKSFFIQGTTPDKFKQYLAVQARRSKDLLNKDIIFLNAWNEWAEGCYLEPDKKNEFQYLEAIREIVNNETSNK
jgi:hypothetical protein